MAGVISRTSKSYNVSGQTCVLWLQGELELEAMPAVDSAMSYSPATSSIMASMDEDEMTTESKQCLQALKEGKK